MTTDDLPKPVSLQDRSLEETELSTHAQLYILVAKASACSEVLSMQITCAWIRSSFDCSCFFMNCQGYPLKIYCGITDTYPAGQQPKHPHTSHLPRLQHTLVVEKIFSAVRIVVNCFTYSILPPLGDSLIVA